jgi:hypothetical protein
MTDPDFADSTSDPFHPPTDSVEVCCLHCGQTYQSSEITWETRQYPDGVVRGFWVCPIEGCDGAGFGFDILPTDPNYQDEHGGWVQDDEDLDDDDLEDEDLEFNSEWNPEDDSDPEFPEYESEEEEPDDSDMPF